MTRLIVGIFCALLSVALLLYTIWLAATGTFTQGLPAVMMALALFLVAALVLKPGRPRF
jgi:hypothetical protein